MTANGTDGGSTSTSAAGGCPYNPATSPSVTEWSAAVFGELHDWAARYAGRWERWDPEYLVLTIDAVDGKAIEPIVIDTCEEELTLGFGYWECDFPDDMIRNDDDSRRASKAAMTLAEAWLEDHVATAIYFDEHDKWCGSRLIETRNDIARLADIAWINFLRPSRVEIRKRDRSAWQSFPLVDSDLIAAVTALLKL